MNRTNFFLLMFVGFSLLADPARMRGTDNFNKLVDEYFDFYFSCHPTEATLAGLHQYDTKLEDYSAAAQEKQASGLKSFLARFQSVDTSRMAPDTAADREWVMSSIRAQLLELEDVQMWRKDPNRYSGDANNSVFLILKRSYAPPEQRLRSIIQREKQIPGLLETARKNLQNPPRIYVEIELEQLPDETDFFRKDLPQAFSAVKDQKLLDEFKGSNRAAIGAFESYQQFLHDSLLTKANGDFQLGSENYRKKLLYDEMVDVPLGRLLEIGYDDLHRNQEALKSVAAQIDSKRSV